MMKKIVAAGIVVFLVCTTVLGAQEDQLIRFSLFGSAIWAPFVYRGYGDLSPDGLLQEADERKTGQGPTFGVGTGPGDNYSAALGINFAGRDPSGRVGIDLSLRAVNNLRGNIDILGNGNIAQLWAYPFGDVLRLHFGLFSWGEMTGRVGGTGTLIGAYGGGVPFQPVDSSDTLGAMFILRPPSSAPDWITGLTIFASIGSSGGLDTAWGRHRQFAARTNLAMKHIFSNPQIGFGYRHDDFGLIRFQYVGSNYLWGQGIDYDRRTVSYPWYGESITVPNYFLPRRARVEPRIETAVNITAIPNINLDVGLSVPLQVAVRPDDFGDVNQTMIGPVWLADLGYRGKTTSWDNNRLAHREGDIWRAPIIIGGGIDFRTDAMPDFAFRLAFSMQFGEQVAFVGHSGTYEAGTKFQIGIQPQYTFSNVGTLAVSAGLRFHQNDTINGTIPTPFSTNDEIIALNSVMHNGMVDLGFSAMLTRTITTTSSIRVGIAMTLPVGGDRYRWHTDDWEGLGLTVPTDIKYFSQEVTERIRQGNLIIAIPIYLNINL